MKDLMLILSDAAPLEFLIDQLQDAITEYKKNASNENRKKVAFSCLLVLNKEAINNTDGGVSKVMEECDRMRDGYNLLNPNKH